MACMEPQVGNIYDGATLIGYRDPVTGVFTAEGATDWEWVEDNACASNHSLNFQWSYNSQYIPLLGGGGMP